jgi:DNA-binding transcriptional LysR family regulator
MCSRISEYAAGDRGKVKILCSPAGLVGALPEHLKSFRLQHPLVDMQLHEQRSPDVVRSVAEREADLGIFAYEAGAEALAVSHGLHVIPYQMVRLVLVTPRNHPLSARRSASFAEATAFDFVGYSDESFIGVLVRRIAREQGLQYRSALTVAGFEALRRMVQADLGIGILPEPCAVPYAEAMHLGCVTLADKWAQYRIGICTREPETLPMSARLMLSHLTTTESSSAAL